MGAVRAATSPKSDVVSSKVKGISVDTLSLQTSSDKATTLDGVNGGNGNAPAASVRVLKSDQESSELTYSGTMDVPLSAMENGHESGEEDTAVGNGAVGVLDNIKVEKNRAKEASKNVGSAGDLDTSESVKPGRRGILGSKPDAPSEATLEPEEGVCADVKATDNAVKQPERRVFRGPRPDFTPEIQAIRAAEIKLKEKHDKQDLITAAWRFKQARRNEAREQLRNIRGTLRGCNDDLKNKFQDLQPVQASLSSLQEKGRAARSKGRELPCSTEEELDRMIAELEYRQMHETMQISEEKLLVREIKRLKGCRDQVRANAVLLSEFTDTEGQRDALQARMKAMQQVVEALKRQRDAAIKIVEEYEAEANSLDAAVNELAQERAKAIAEHQAAYTAVVAARTHLTDLRTKYQNGELPASFRRKTKTLEEDVLALMESTGTGCAVLGAVSFDNLQSEKSKQPAPTGETRSNGNVEKAKVASSELKVSGTPHIPELEDKKVSSPSTQIAVEKTRGSSSAFSGKEKTRKTPAPPPIIERADHLLLPARPSGASDSTSEQAHAGGESMAQTKEKRRLEAIQKQKEAEERKRRQAERSEARAKARAEKEAEEAAKRREKEKERKAQKKLVSVKGSDGELAADETAALTPEMKDLTATVNKVPSTKMPAGKDVGALSKKLNSVIKKGKKIVVKPAGKRDMYTRFHINEYTVAMIFVTALIGILLYYAQRTKG